jgi:hypothetical protein
MIPHNQILEMKTQVTEAIAIIMVLAFPFQLLVTQDFTLVIRS